MRALPRIVCHTATVLYCQSEERRARELAAGVSMHATELRQVEAEHTLAQQKLTTAQVIIRHARTHSVGKYQSCMF